MTCARKAAAEKTSTRKDRNIERKIDSPLNLVPAYGRFDASGDASQLPDALKKLTCGFTRLSLNRSNGDGVDDVLGLTAAGKVIRRRIQTLQNGADCRSAGKSFS